MPDQQIVDHDESRLIMRKMRPAEEMRRLRKERGLRFIIDELASEGLRFKDQDYHIGDTTTRIIGTYPGSRPDGTGPEMIWLVVEMDELPNEDYAFLSIAYVGPNGKKDIADRSLEAVMKNYHG